MPLTRAILGAILLVLAAPSTAAVSVSMEITSAHDIALEGSLTAELTGAAGRIIDEGANLVVPWTRVTGTLEIHSWSHRVVAGEQIPAPAGDLTNRTISLTAAELAWVFADEPLVLTFANASNATVAGAVDAVDAPTWLEAPASNRIGPGVPWQTAPHVEAEWSRGWAFLGEYRTTPATMRGTPTLGSAILTVDGNARFQLGSGNLTVATPEGVESIRLGVWNTSRPPGPAEVLPVIEQRMVRAILRADAVYVSLPLEDSWGVAAPDLAWTIDGRAAWTAASGRVVVDGVEHTLSSEPVSVDGVVRLTLAPRGASQERTSYEGGGEVRGVLVGGAVVGEPPSQLVRDLGFGLAALALLLAILHQGMGLAARLVAPLYTRLTPGELLAHPRRAQLLRIANERPGIHLRELQRILGGAWGPFQFHFQMLVQFGYLRVEKLGRYKVVHPRGASADVIIPNPAQRAVYEATPPAGAPIEIIEVERTTGLSRQLVSYHIRQLEQRGLIVRADMRGERRVARSNRE